METKRRAWLASLALAASTTLLTLVLVSGVGEWAVRRRERTRTSVPGSMSMMFYRHKRLMHGLVRGSDYYGWVHIGRQGFRGVRDVSETPPDSVIRIMAVGGSTTFDSNTQGDSSAWPARLEQILDSTAAPRRFEVLNAGVPGFQVFDDLVRLEYELYRFKPAIIILYQGHNDLFNGLSQETGPRADSFDPRPGEIVTVYPWEHWLEQHSLLYHKLRSKFEAIRYHSEDRENRQRATAADYQRFLDAGAASFDRSVRGYLSEAQSLGIKVIVPQVVYAAHAPAGQGGDSAITALWSQAMPFAPPSIIWQGYARYDSIETAAAAHYGVMHVPSGTASLWQLDSYADGDPIHFNDKGSWRFAEHMADVVRALPEVNAAPPKSLPRVGALP
jgi:hypothetical protein